MNGLSLEQCLDPWVLGAPGPTDPGHGGPSLADGLAHQVPGRWHHAQGRDGEGRGGDTNPSCPWGSPTPWDSQTPRDSPSPSPLPFIRSIGAPYSQRQARAERACLPRVLLAR